MKLYIKNMTCSHCKAKVKSELEKFGLHPTLVELGEVEILEELDRMQLEKLNQALQEFGYTLIDGKRSQMELP